MTEEQINDAEMADLAEIYADAYRIGWLRAKFDGERMGFFPAAHYPAGSPEHDGYSAFVKSVDKVRRLA